MKPNSKLFKDSQRLLTRLLLLSFLFFALGMGNLFVGMFKSHQYQKLLQQTRYEMANQDTRPLVPLVQSPLDIDNHTAHIKRLEHRLDYYRLVTLGGKIFLALCGVLLLATLITRRYPNEENLKKEDHSDSDLNN